MHTYALEARHTGIVVEATSADTIKGPQELYPDGGSGLRQNYEFPSVWLAAAPIGTASDCVIRINKSSPRPGSG
jgi:hypothetical protein